MIKLSINSLRILKYLIINIFLDKNLLSINLEASSAELKISSVNLETSSVNLKIPSGDLETSSVKPIIYFDKLEINSDYLEISSD